MNFAPNGDREAVDFNELQPAPKPVSLVSPIYPSGAAVHGVTGVARIVVSLRDGAIVQTWVAQEVPQRYGFGAAADRAVRQWRFASGYTGLYTVEVRFALDAGRGREASSPQYRHLPRLPVPVHAVGFRYPAAADGKPGAVRLAVTLAEDGSVIAAAIVSEDPPGVGFGQAAVDAMLLWRFEPAQAGVYRGYFEIRPRATR